MTEVKCILMAEDDPRDVELTLEALAENKIANELVVVNDGAAALDYLYHRGEFAHRTNGNPTLVLLDIKMPKVDGIEVLRRIRGDANLRLIPVVILTSSREQRDLIASYDLGVNAYVVKPVDFQDFQAAIQALGLFWAVVNEPPVGSLGKSTQA
jgi:CheY-like chemotaxis protein